MQHYKYLPGGLKYVLNSKSKEQWSVLKFQKTLKGLKWKHKVTSVEVSFLGAQNPSNKAELDRDNCELRRKSRCWFYIYDRWCAILLLKLIVLHWVQEKYVKKLKA